MAFLISLFALYYAHAAHELANKVYEEERKLIVKVEINDEKNKAVVLPVDNLTEIQVVQITFPKDFDSNATRYFRPNLTIDLNYTNKLLLKYFIELYKKKISAKNKTVGLWVGVPVELGYQYIIKGNSYTDRARYEILYYLTIGDDSLKNANTLILKDIRFINHIQKDEKNTWDKINNKWETSKAQTHKKLLEKISKL